MNKGEGVRGYGGGGRGRKGGEDDGRKRTERHQLIETSMDARDQSARQNKARTGRQDCMNGLSFKRHCPM